MLLNCGVGEDSSEGPLDCKDIQQVHPKGDQSWVFIGRTHVKAETPILWPPDEKSWLIGKDPDAGKDWGQEEKGTTEDKMVGWHHWLNRHGFEWTLGVGDGQRGLAGCNSWGHKESDTTDRLNWTEGDVRFLLKLSWNTISGASAVWNSILLPTCRSSTLVIQMHHAQLYCSYRPPCKWHALKLSSEIALALMVIQIFDVNIIFLWVISSPMKTS